MFQWARKTGRRLISAWTLVTRSVLSWMHWRLTRTAREQKQEAALTQLLLLQLEQQELLFRLAARADRLLEVVEQQPPPPPPPDHRPLLLEAMRPLAAALLRQDSQRSQQQAETRELLQEVLNSLQPAAREQIFQRIGPPPPKNFFRDSVS